ncbi:OmpA family protein [uncultured Algibacter sp.]|uniref:OmpA family protein n=1 Tax=uncultured Algibacter sp. TaxID=298659 RepID=UPI0026170082|nr:OmpA family protein [uncultured Algibacter sp.]
MKTNYLIFILVFTIGTSFAQSKLADKFFSNYGYVKATELYKKAFDDGDNSEHVLTRLGDCYYNNSNSEKAVFWYQKAAEKYKIDSEHLFKYIQSLKSIGNYSEADIWTKKFIEIQNDDSRLKDYDANNLLKYESLNAANDSLSITIENLPINSKFSDFGSLIKNNELVFASARGIVNNNEYGWNKEPFLDLFQVSIKEDNCDLEFGDIALLKSSKINSNYHEATVAITNDGKTMYFTRDNVTKKNKLNFDKKGTTHLKIYKATLIDGSWENIKELSINDEVYSTGHPTLSPDNKKLFFVSDRKGGIGQTDIYEVDILDNNKYSEPKNLGPKINTEGREMFPFVSKDSTLYFSSDGRLNLGLLDIFKSNILKDSISEPKNLGAPYNSGYDDFAYYIDSSENINNRSFLSSNRPGGKGNDDIYTVYSKVCSQTIRGIVRNSNDNQPLSKVKVNLIDEIGKIVDEIITVENGKYEFDVKCDKKYTIQSELLDFSVNQIQIKTDNKNGNVTERDLFLESLIKGNQIVIKPIFFDFDKWTIRTDAKYELENIVDVLRNYPTMVIKIESHTDSRGRDNYNMRLSDKRAKSTRDYILSRGIAKARIESALGYGESQLLNSCSNGVKCTSEEHQINRRSYFYIVKE